jgi:anti-sigma B factor antagonist
VTINIRKAKNATILDLNGPMKMGDAEQSFRNHVQELLDSGTNQMAVNLAGVPEMDSSGIGALVRAYTSVKRAGGRCLFFSPSKRVVMILKMVRLDTVLEIVEDEATALARF